MRENVFRRQNVRRLNIIHQSLSAPMYRRQSTGTKSSLRQKIPAPKWCSSLPTILYSMFRVFFMGKSNLTYLSFRGHSLISIIFSYRNKFVCCTNGNCFARRMLKNNLVSKFLSFSLGNETAIPHFSAVGWKNSRTSSKCDRSLRNL